MRYLAAVVGVTLGVSPAPATTSATMFIYTEAPRYEARAALAGRERFPSGARLVLRTGLTARPLVPGFAASADAAISFNGKRILFSGKRRPGDPWQVWEVALAGGAPHQVTQGSEDCIQPRYLPRAQVVYSRRTPLGYQIETAELDGGQPERLTFLPGNHVVAAVLRDGRILFEAPHPEEQAPVADLFTVYSDGSGVETYRCDHGPDRHSAIELASGDILFQTGTRLARFTSARAVQVDQPLPPGDYLGPAAEISPREWLVGFRPPGAATYALALVAPGSSKAPVVVVKAKAYQPVIVRSEPVPPYHPSGLGNRDGANLLCLNAYLSKPRCLPAGALSTVRVWGRDESGEAVPLGEAPVESDGSFFVQVPSERPLRFELLDPAGRTVRAEKGWFWTRKGEQRVCVGCHTGPERAPGNAVPQVLLRTQSPVPMSVEPVATGGR
jgi:hypothetical protein